MDRHRIATGSSNIFTFRAAATIRDSCRERYADLTSSDNGCMVTERPKSSD